MHNTILQGYYSVHIQHEPDIRSNMSMMIVDNEQDMPEAPGHALICNIK